MGTADDETPRPADDEAAPEVPAARTGLRRVLTALTISWPYLVSALVALGVALWTYRPWRLRGSMMAMFGDPLAFYTWVQATMEDGWYEQASRLSAPYEMNSHTYTVTDELLFGVIGKVLGPLTGSAAGGVTLWVILTFPLAAVFAVGAARYLGVGRAAALVPGIAFALLPDHFLRSFGHFSLTSTWAVSLGALVAISLLRSPRFGRRGRMWFEVAMIVAAVAISLTNAYYATFTALLVATTGVGGAIARRSWVVLARGVARGTALVGPILVAMALDSAYAPRPAGYSSFAITRQLADAEIYGGKIVAMLLPSPIHRSGRLRSLRASYDGSFPNPAETPALGLVAAAGFVGLVIWALVGYFRRRPELADARLRPLAAMMWVSLFAYVVGGLGSAWALLLQGGGIRVWSRMHVVIALLALLVVAVAVDRLRGRLLRAAAVGALLVVVLLDQTTSMPRPDADRALAVRAELTELTSGIADQAGTDAMIYQAPYVTFPIPQVDVGSAGIYDGFLPYLHSTATDLHWSYGGLQGDPGIDWQLELAARPVAETAPMLAAAGFDGVLLDRTTGASQPDLEAQMRDVLGPPILVSASGRWAYFPLDLTIPSACRTADVEEELSALAVAPPLLYPGDGLRTAPGSFTSAGGTSELRIVTLREGGWPEVEASFTVENPTTPVRVTFPDGTDRDLPVGSNTVQWSGGVTATETAIVLRGEVPAASYSVHDLVASTSASARAGECIVG